MIWIWYHLNLYDIMSMICAYDIIIMLYDIICIWYHMHISYEMYVWYILTSDIMCIWYHIHHACYHVNDIMDDIIFNFGLSCAVTRYQVFSPQGRSSQARASYDSYGGSYNTPHSWQMTPRVRVRWWNICARGFQGRVWQRPQPILGPNSGGFWNMNIQALFATVVMARVTAFGTCLAIGQVLLQAKKNMISWTISYIVSFMISCNDM
jgi:hypothetical protein